jgi:hypothetical protein
LAGDVFVRRDVRREMSDSEVYLVKEILNILNAAVEVRLYI